MEDSLLLVKYNKMQKENFCYQFSLNLNNNLERVELNLISERLFWRGKLINFVLTDFCDIHLPEFVETQEEDDTYKILRKFS